MWTIKRGDTRTALKATLLGPNNKPVDLTKATVRFLMVDQEFAPVLTRETLVVDATNGQVLVVFESGTTEKAGTYKAEFEAVFPDGTIETYPNDRYIVVKIMPDLGQVPFA